MESQTIPPRNEGMYLRLEKASHAGDLEELRQLLQEDGLLLHRPNTLHPADSPLHIAAALGHAHFVKEILARKPECALGFNTQGLTALHLACANGHSLVVRELLQSSIGVEICCVRDRYGLLPIHTAALTGNVPVLEELLGACSDEVVRGLTCLGDSILHLVVKSNCFEAVKFLVERLESCHHELLSLGDAKGNTILHLATARKQLQVQYMFIFNSFLLSSSISFLSSCKLGSIENHEN